MTDCPFSHIKRGTKLFVIYPLIVEKKEGNDAIIRDWCRFIVLLISDGRLYVMLLSAGTGPEYSKLYTVHNLWTNYLTITVP